MNLNINIKNNNDVKFADIKDHEYFTWDGKLYLKTILNYNFTTSIFNCYCFNSATHAKLHDQTIVTRIKSLKIDAETE